MSFPWQPNKAFGLPDYSIRAFLTFQLLLGWQYYIAKGIAVPEKYRYVVFVALGLYFGKELLLKVLGNPSVKKGLANAVESELSANSVSIKKSTIDERTVEKSS